MADAAWGGGPEILDLVHDSIIVRDMDGTVAQWNLAAETQYGWSRAEAVGRKLSDILPCAGGGLLERIEAELLAEGSWEGELSRRDRAGRERRIDVRWSVRCGPDGLPGQIIETGRDVTEQRANEAAARLGEYRFRNLFEAVAVAFLEIDFKPVAPLLLPLRHPDIPDLRSYLLERPSLVREMMAAARILNVNARTVELLGAASKDEIVGRGTERYWPDESMSVFVGSLIAMFDKKPGLVSETVVCDLRGKPLDVLFTVAWSPESRQEGVLLIGLIDITDRKKASEEIRRSEIKFRNLFNQTPIALWQLDSRGAREMLDSLYESGVTDYDAFVAANADFLPSLREKMRIVEINPAALALVGASDQDKSSPIVFDHLFDSMDALRASAARRRGDTSFSTESQIRTLDGRVLDVLSSIAFADAQDPDALNLVAAIDITDRKRATHKLERSEVKFRNLFDQTPIALWQLDTRAARILLDTVHVAGVTDLQAYGAANPDFLAQVVRRLKVTEINDAALALFGATDRATLRPKMLSLWLDNADLLRASMARAAGEPSYNVETRIQTLDGRTIDIWLSVVFGAASDPHLNLVGAVDISERKRATAAMAQSELKYRNLFHYMPIALAQLDVSELIAVFGQLRREGVADLDDYIDAHPDFVGQMLEIMRIEQVNETMAGWIGRGDPAEFVGPITRFWSRSEDAIRRSLCARYSGAETHSEETRVQALDGRMVDCLFTSAFPTALSDMGIGLVGFVDITGRVEAERMLEQVRADFAHAARVATLGELSASIAHEVNQPLAAIATNGEASLRWLDRAEPDVGEARKLAVRMVADARRAADVIGHIRAMATRQSAGREPLAVNDVVAETLGFLQRELQAKEVEVEFDPAAGLPQVEADRTQLQQVLVNLAVNAEQAMVQHGVADRRLTVRTALAESGCVCVDVEDSGPGIPDDLAARLFDSFVTTKPNGLGIGLSICRSIIEAHGGRINAANGERGARFRFTLPAAAAEEETQRALR